MKKVSMSLVSLLILFMGSCSLSVKYAEVKRLMSDYIETTNKLAKALESNNDSKAVALALNEYITHMKQLGPLLEAIPGKYPELEKNPPADLEELAKEFEKSTDSMNSVYKKLLNYKNDPDVIKALEMLKDM